NLCERARRGGDRPMLKGRTREQTAALYEDRKRFYAQADVTVDTSGLTPDQVAGRVAAGLAGRARQVVWWPRPSSSGFSSAPSSETGPWGPGSKPTGGPACPVYPPQP